jgi:hypothetical protein
MRRALPAAGGGELAPVCGLDRDHDLRCPGLSLDLVDEGEELRQLAAAQLRQNPTHPRNRGAGLAQGLTHGSDVDHGLSALVEVVGCAVHGFILVEQVYDCQELTQVFFAEFGWGTTGFGSGEWTAYAIWLQTRTGH